MSEILVEQKGAIGHIRLNRPKAINALSLDMIRSISGALSAFASNSTIAAVLVTGEGERGLCAGGDIRALYDHRTSGTAFGLAFFQDEYRLNAQVAAFPKPYIAIMDGITMGGGVGISAHGSVRVVTERTRLAMPETGIGFFPDIGASWLLSRTPGELGTYMTLTGQSIGGGDAIFAGLADHFVPSEKLAELVNILTKLPLTAGAKEIHASIRNLSEQADALLAKNIDEIDSFFYLNDAKDIIAALQRADTYFSRQTLEIMAQKSPTGMQVALRLLRLAKQSQNLEECLEREYSACKHFLTGTEFYEGIRAAVVDKDRQPKWQPASLAEVTEDQLAPYFVPSKTRLF